ncbi:30S ribosomal protein S6 [candidate division WOR-3 bacterium]|nr:30S ribosomal protein S6 [candidate division WOR-3 bacterium]
MREYENLIIFNPEIGEEAIDKRIDEIKKTINKKGEFLKLDKWGSRRLAYPINKKEKGYYALLEFKAENETLQELNNKFKLSDDIMRHCIVRKET